MFRNKKCPTPTTPRDIGTFLALRYLLGIAARGMLYSGCMQVVVSKYVDIVLHYGCVYFASSTVIAVIQYTQIGFLNQA